MRGVTRLASRTKGWEPSNELSNEDREEVALASGHRRSSSRVFLYGATSIGVFESRGLWPSLAYKLNPTDATRRLAFCFNSTFAVVADSADGSRARKRKRHVAMFGYRARHDVGALVLY